MRILNAFAIIVSILCFSTPNSAASEKTDIDTYCSKEAPKSFPSVKEQLEDYKKILALKKDRKLTPEIENSFFGEKAREIFRVITCSDYIRIKKESEDKLKDFLSQKRSNQLGKIILDMETKIKKNKFSEFEMCKTMQQFMHWRDFNVTIDDLSNNVDFTGLYKDPSDINNFSKEDLRQLKSNDDRINAFVLKEKSSLFFSTVVDSIFEGINLFPIFTDNRCVAHYGAIRSFGDHLAHDFLHFKQTQDLINILSEKKLFDFFKEINKMKSIIAYKKGSKIVNYFLFLTMHEKPNSLILFSESKFIYKETKKNKNNLTHQKDFLFELLSESIYENIINYDSNKNFKITKEIKKGIQSLLNTTFQSYNDGCKILDIYNFSISSLKETSDVTDKREIACTIDLVKKRHNTKASKSCEIDAQIIVKMALDAKDVGYFSTPYFITKEGITKPLRVAPFYTFDLKSSIAFDALFKMESVLSILNSVGKTESGVSFYDIISNASPDYKNVAEPLVYVLDNAFTKEWRSHDLFPSFEQIANQCKVLVRKMKIICENTENEKEKNEQSNF